MQKIYIKRGLPGSNPLANVLIVLVGAIVISLVLVLGFFAFLAFSAVVLVTATFIAVRSWWTGRKAPPAAARESRQPGEFIEGEFHVVKKDKTS